MIQRPVFRALNRPKTLLGVERKLFFALVVGCYSLFHLSGALLSSLFIFLGLWLLAQRATQIDPQLLQVFVKSVRFKARYDPALRPGKGGWQWSR